MRTKGNLTFLAGCLCEVALLVVALTWDLIFRRPLLQDCRWNARDALLGAAAAVPPFVFFIWTLRTKVPALASHRELMERLLLPLFGQWSIWQLALISVLAGISEEALFRGAIQGGLAERVGLKPALVLAAVAFGAAHLVTWTYAIIAAFIGLYLGLLWIWSGNLLTPIVTHAAYDFVALVYFLRVRARNSGQ